ncbi:MAG: HAD-IA family hydrolase [Rubrivivax sp.]|nr:HAD-IA family hydrolase [Rubrivivax sp.]
MRARVWFFDLDNTLHDATHASYAGINEGMTSYIVEQLGVTSAEAGALRQRYWQRYGATLLGLIRHHGVQPGHFLHHAHRLPGLEERVYGHAHDLHVLRRLARLPGRRCILTNAPAAYTARVLGALGIAPLFHAVLSIEDMRMFGQWRPKPDARMLARMAVRLRANPRDCVLVEDTLEHQKAARGVGMRTVWMQRWLRPAASGPRPPGMLGATANGASKSPRVGAAPHKRPAAGRPAYVDRRIRRLGELLRR